MKGDDNKLIIVKQVKSWRFKLSKLGEIDIIAGQREKFRDWLVKCKPINQVSNLFSVFFFLENMEKKMKKENYTFLNKNFKMNQQKETSHRNQEESWKGKLFFHIHNFFFQKTYIANTIKST